MRKLDTVSDVLDSAVAAGGDATRVNSVSFSVDDPEVPLKDARTKALANAKAHAEVLAAAAGVKLGPARSITESGGGITPPPFERQAAQPVPSGAPTPISPGQQELMNNVSVVYGIQ